MAEAAGAETGDSLLSFFVLELENARGTRAGEILGNANLCRGRVFSRNSCSTQKLWIPEVERLNAMDSRIASDVDHHVSGFCDQSLSRQEGPDKAESPR
jgi:hypothetical protein